MKRYRLIVVAVIAVVVGVMTYLWMRGDGRHAQARHGDHAGHAHHGHDGAAEYYTCGMHPWVVLPEPGLCPICHMELTPLDPGRLSGEIAIDPVMVQNIGVRIAPVERGPVVRHVRTVGTVAYDERRIGVATTKIAGWIEKLHVAAEGDVVAAGDPLFDLYSPQLYAAQVEYLLAYRGRESAGGDQLLESARTRLAYLDVSPRQIEQLEASGEASRVLTVHSPHAGVVTQLLVRQGDRIEAGTPTHRIVDLSRIWVIAAVYEQQMSLVKVGQKATMTLAAVPGRTFQGQVDYVYPTVDATSRQGRVRLAFDNSDGLLKPGMFAAVELISQSSGDALLVPREAVLDTGQRQLVFVSLGQGRFEPRDVTLGTPTSDGRVEVLSGLEEGEQVVTSGQFLLDSESRMRSALAQMVRGDMASDQAPVVPVETSEHDHHASSSIDAETQKAINAVVAHYLAITRSLARDEAQGLAATYEALHHAAAAVDHALAPAVAEAAKSPPADIEAMRTHLAALSTAVINLAAAAPAATDQPLYVAHCPMAAADWLQVESQVINPYMGARMLRCGAIEYAITAPGQAKEGTP